MNVSIGDTILFKKHSHYHKDKQYVNVWTETFGTVKKLCARTGACWINYTKCDKTTGVLRILPKDFIRIA